MTRPYDLVVFDWEGTLGDTMGQILHDIKAASLELGLGELQETHARQCLGFGLTKAIKKMFPVASEEQYKRLLNKVQMSMGTYSMDVWLIPGARELVQDMHRLGFHLAIATNKGAQSLSRALDLSGLADYFNITRSAGQTPPKPCPQMLLEIMDYFNVDKTKTVMIGDSVTDIEMAQLAGVDAIGVNFYQQDSTDFLKAGALAVFDDYQIVANYLNCH